MSETETIIRIAEAETRITKAIIAAGHRILQAIRDATELEAKSTLAENARRIRELERRLALLEKPTS